MPKLRFIKKPSFQRFKTGISVLPALNIEFVFHRFEIVSSFGFFPAGGALLR
jgi:hypothetical protein